MAECLKCHKKATHLVRGTFVTRQWARCKAKTDEAASYCAACAEAIAEGYNSALQRRDSGGVRRR